ncbi:uncharacterized protein LOC110181258 [Drosophila serrata]|uniref:uncharacterized protein LOC110181258 n=1 Tax=Drosophila serrata TaxID=7274 RepID=UPI000A1D12CD|nr:uncharacterized protein LOC110181258 [Drosophila serrata]
MESSSSGAIMDMEGSSPGDPSQPTQITSIDGFFNRKRGRPPKNRFVEVYKSAQHSPQAIFTSFKLERSDHPSPASIPSSMGETLEERLPRMDHDGSSSSSSMVTDLNPSRNRKRGRVWAPNSVTTEQSSRRNLTVRTEATLQSSHIEAVAQPNTQPIESIVARKPTCKELERKSVVRAAGTFYPENVNSSLGEEISEAQSLTRLREESLDLDVDQPEDLSMRPSLLPETLTTAGRVGVAPPLSMNLLQFKQLIDLYQRQVLLPSFLAAATQPLAGGATGAVPGAATLTGSAAGPLLDVRLLLGNAAHQKFLLLNAAAAAAAATATATAAAAAATSETGQRTPVRRSRDQDIPTGYLKFRFNEDCGFERCGYRNHQSHFHCNRRDCHYSFCDKTRFVQHTARHERMDTLMGDDFRQFRANMQCGVASCSYSLGGVTESSSQQQQRLDEASGASSKKTSHFHCRKCDYVCTDSNKVVAHRRLHLRQDYVRSAGFRKVAGNEACNSTSCSYALRHTHYHCVTCDGGVLSRAQLAAHKHRTPLTKSDTTP